MKKVAKTSSPLYNIYKRIDVFLCIIIEIANIQIIYGGNNMPNRLFQGIINQMRNVVNNTIGVVDESGTVISSSELGIIGETRKGVISGGVFNGPLTVLDGSTYKAFGDSAHPEYAVFVDGTDDLSRNYAGIIAISLEQIKKSNDEKFDRSNFVKNVVLDNILPGDIYIKSRELHFNNDATRVVFLIRVTKETDVSVFDVVQNFFPDKSKDFVININETDIALIKEVRPNIESRDLEKLAQSICDTLASEFYCSAIIGIGVCVTGIKELAKSFKEAQVALEVAKVFDNEKTIISYENLGIARLIYQLPTTLCEMFLKEVFKKGSIDSLDSETLFTIQKFFENNLNVSETSRKLFVHRNTLVYRLEKIKKLTGLDLREFDDAIVFKVALMVNKYLSSTPVKY